MAHSQQVFTNALLDTIRGNNPMVNDLAKRRLYDTAVEEMNVKDKRPKVNFCKSVNEEQTLMISQAYPEFQLSFYNTQLAVHSVAAGLRNLELEYLMMQVPYGSVTFDIGGNFASHLFKGRNYVHCCMPNLDMRDVMRHENQKDAVEVYLSKMSTKGKPIPSFQMPAFERYANDPDATCCHEPFQTCPFQPLSEGRRYAVALHSIYDIPADEFGAALLRKDIHTCYAAFHFSELLLLEANKVELPEIGAIFTRDGDRLNFCFINESTLNYSHNYSNVLKYVCKTYFPASNRIVYMKEFLVTRVNTMFCKFVKVDTFLLYKGVAGTAVDTEQFYKAMEDSWHYKKTLAMLNSERIMLQDSSSVNFWFPKMKDLVIVPLFDISFQSGRRSRSEVLVNKDFVFTVLNHIRTYQAKALTYNNVLSFVESIRSRVIINGVTARSEWDVDKSLLQSLSMTFFLITRLNTLKDEMLIQKFDLGRRSVAEHFWKEIENAVGNIFPWVKDYLINKKLLVTNDQALEISVPDLYVSFHDHFITEYKKSVEMPPLDISRQLTEAEKYFNALSELSTVKTSTDFDVEKFTRMCQLYNADPELAAKIVIAVLENESGVSIPFKDTNEATLAESISQSGPKGLMSIKPSDAEVSTLSTMVSDQTVPQQGLSLISNPTFERNDDIVTLEEYHMMAAESVIQGKMASIVYQGPLKSQQMENYVDSLAASLSASVSNLKKVIKDTSGVLSDTQSKYGVFCVRRKAWLLQPSKRNHSWGLVEMHNGECKLAFLTYEGDAPICAGEWRRVAVSDESLIYSDMAKLRSLRQSMGPDRKPPIPTAEMILVDGVPGCGKTKEILSRVNLEEDLILVPGREAAAMIRRRANANLNGSILATHDNVKTVDSFLMNLGKGPKTQWKTLFIDEGLMLHPGCVYFLVVLSHCEKAYIYGDTQQIPFINRVQNFPFPSHFAKLQVDSVETRRTTLRCPADVTHFLNQKYDGTVMCTSTVDRSVGFEVVSGAATVNPVSKPLKGKIVTFTQSDKSALLSRGYTNVNTVHEIQGETFEEVSLVRLTATPVNIISSSSPHVLVALSRHTKQLKYYTVVVDSLVNIIRDLESVSHFLLDLYKVESPIA